MTEKRIACEKKGCAEKTIKCRVWNEETKDYAIENLCPEHAEEAGYCYCCGEFCAGQNGFDWIHPGLCDNCKDEIDADIDDGEEEYYD